MKKNDFKIYMNETEKCPDRAEWIRSCALNFLSETDTHLNFETARTDTGKPYFKYIPDLFLSISHTDDKLLLVLAESPVGADLQIMRFKTHSQDAHLNAGALSARFFHPEECSYINSDESLAVRRFFEIWTKKEAYVKMTGTGIDRNFSAFSVLNLKCRFFTEYLSDNLCMSVCIRDF